MVEAHGPGTPVGDPIEYASLAEVYGTRRAVRARIGEDQLRAHPVGCRSAGADEGGPRACSTVWFRGICTSPGCLMRWPQIETKLFVPQENTPWPSNGHHGPRRAAVSSYGFSGTNVHAIVEQAPETTAPRRRANRLPPSTDRWFSRCRPRRPTDCGKPRGGSLTGSTHTRWTLRHRIWRTPLLAGVRTGRCARRSSQAASRS